MKGVGQKTTTLFEMSLRVHPPAGGEDEAILQSHVGLNNVVYILRYPLARRILQTSLSVR